MHQGRRRSPCGIQSECSRPPRGANLGQGIAVRRFGVCTEPLPCRPLPTAKCQSPVSATDQTGNEAPIPLPSTYRGESDVGGARFSGMTRRKRVRSARIALACSGLPRVVGADAVACCEREQSFRRSVRSGRRTHARDLAGRPRLVVILPAISAKLGRSCRDRLLMGFGSPTVKAWLGNGRQRWVHRERVEVGNARKARSE